MDDAEIKATQDQAWGKWAQGLTGLLIAGAGLVAGFNAFVDPYGVFGTDIGMSAPITLNERYAKVEHLLANPDAANSFVIGSSVMGLFPVDAFREAVPQGSWYNLAFLGGGPGEALRALKAVEQGGVAIHRVALGIDIVNFRSVGDASEMWKREHPATASGEWGRWWLSHLFASSAMDGWRRVKATWQGKSDIEFETATTGQYRLVSMDAEAERDPKAFAAAHHKKPAEREPAKLVLVQKRLGELKELLDWLKARDVAVTLWINPMHQDSLDMCTADSIEEFRKRIFALTGPIPDFTRDRRMTEDSVAFYDDKHFSPRLGRSIVGQVFSRSDADAVVAEASRAR